MNPLKVKASGSPITPANISGLQTMTDAEVKNYIANVITEKFGTTTTGSGTAEINITTDNSGSGTSIGTFVDTNRTESIGTHPATGSTTSTTYYVKQVTAAASENITNRPLAWDSRLEEMSDSDIDSIMDLCIEAMVAESSYTAGQYRLSPTAPTGGTWVSRYTITDTAQGGNTVTYLWQKTAASSTPNSDYTPLKLFNSNNCRQMVESEIEQMLPNFRNRIIDTGIATYKIQSTAPSGGTWVEMGSQFADTREQVSPQNYAGTYTGSFTGFYSGTYGGVVNYSGTYSNTFSTTINYTTPYSSNFSGNYLGTAPYSGFFSEGGVFTGITYTAPLGPLVPYSGTYTGSPFYSAFYSGPGTAYSGNYAAYYSGSRNYAGNYAGVANYSGPANYSGSRTYSGNYAGEVNYTGIVNYSGSRTYSGNYAGTYTGPPISYEGPYPTTTYGGYYSQPGTWYTGYYTGPANEYDFFGPIQTNFIGYYSGPAVFQGVYTGAPTTIWYTGYYQGPDLAPGEPGDVFVGEYSGTGPGTYTGPIRFGIGNYTGSYLGPLQQQYAGSYQSPPGPAYLGFYEGPIYYSGQPFVSINPLYFLGPGENYTGFYAGSRNYAGTYAGEVNYAGIVNYSGTRNYAGTYAGVGNYSGPANYSGSRNYTGNYITNYTGFYSATVGFQGTAYGTAYTGNYNGFVPPTPYTGYFSGPGGSYTGYFTGPANYSGTYTGYFSAAPYQGPNYTGNFTGNYAGGGSFTGNYSGSYINNFTGNYSGATIQATKDTVSTVKLWIRTA